MREGGSEKDTEGGGDRGGGGTGCASLPPVRVGGSDTSRGSGNGCARKREKREGTKEKKEGEEREGREKKLGVVIWVFF